jgi:hypothetical protein
VKVGGGYQFWVALTRERRSVDKGSTYNIGELGREGKEVKDPGEASLPIPIVDFSCRYRHVLVLSKYGEEFTWRQNGNGEPLKKNP